MIGARWQQVLLIAVATSSCTSANSHPAASPAAVRAAACPPSPNCVSSRAADQAHQIAPLVLPDRLGEPMAVLREIVAGLDGAHIVSSGGDSLVAEFHSRLFGFVDDLTLELDRNVRLVQVRSAARSGWYDFGVNRRRVEQIRAKLTGGTSRANGSP